MKASGNPLIVMWFLVSVLALLMQSFTLAGAQNLLREKVWGAAVFTLYGESTPYALPHPRTLTPLGAQQLLGAGSALRKRYLRGNADTRINGISEFKLDGEQTAIYSPVAQFISASAQAFMQGLYPPLSGSYNTTAPVGGSDLVNGT